MSGWVAEPKARHGGKPPPLNYLRGKSSRRWIRTDIVCSYAVLLHRSKWGVPQDLSWPLMLDHSKHAVSLTLFDQRVEILHIVIETLWKLDVAGGTFAT